MIASGKIRAKGVVAPEGAFDPIHFIKELARRGIYVHEKVEETHVIAEQVGVHDDSGGRRTPGPGNIHKHYCYKLPI
jgi:hypothetical protein